MLLDKELEFHNLIGKVKVVSSVYTGPVHDSDEKRPMVGEPGTRTIVIEALKPTESADSLEHNMLHFILARPWELKQAEENGVTFEPV
jgi:hypothetical protein